MRASWWKILERGCLIIGSVCCFSTSLIAFEIVRRKERADIEICDIGGAESTPALTLKVPSDSQHTKPVGNVFSSSI